MVKSETHRDAEILVRNPSPILFGEKFRDPKKVKTNHEKTRLRDLSKTDPAKIFRDSRFSRYHSPPLESSSCKISALIDFLFLKEICDLLKENLTALSLQWTGK